MRKIRPLEIGEFTPMTVPEMKNVFGGSGDFTASGSKKCATEGQACPATATIQTSFNAPSEIRPIPGYCRTLRKVEVNETFCDCVYTGEKPSGTTSITPGPKCIEIDAD